MIEFWQNFHFLRPWLLLFLLIPLGLYFLKLKKLAVVSSWEDICDKNLLPFLLVNNGSIKKISILKFIYIGLITAIIAAAGPAWKKIEIPALAAENPNMFVISLAQDMQLRDIPPSRLDRAKFMLSDIADNVNQGQFGIEVYSQEPYTVTPLTEDIQLIKNILSQIVPDIVPDQGDRLDRAIDLAVERFKSAGYTSGNIILFASDVGQRFDFALEKTKEATANNFSVHVIDTSFDGNEKLQLLAETGHGIYLRVQDTNPYKLTEYINNTYQHHMTQNNNSRSGYADYGYYLLFIVLFCLLPFFRKGLLFVALCVLSTQAQAGFLLNDEQQGLAYFNQGQYDQALMKFKNPDWRGVTLYRQNKFEEALKEFEKSTTSDAVYNKGVILAKLCQYLEALTAFEEAIKLNPQNMDALSNKQSIITLLDKAKDDPSVLDCQNNQENKQPDKNNQNDDDNTNQNQDQQNQDSQEDNNDQSDSSETENSSDTQQENEDSNSQKNNESDQAQNRDNTNQKQSNSPENDSDSDIENKENQQNEKTEQMTSSESQNNEKTSAQQNTSLTQQMQMMNAKEGEDEKYDEEALALQRRYREIPEDVGGLLREFIKKEHLKDRYSNETM